jgi:hypothetical protein
MTRDTRIQLGAAGVLVLCLAASALLATQMTVTAGRARMMYTDRVEESDSWEVSLGIALGAFRGIFVNTLWMRANDLKQDGKFYESVELARAITRLQPRFPQVWVFHAWNLAYNISVMTQTPVERWNWVNQGIRILREEGIPANPNNMLMHKELGWIFLHKIQGVTDDANPVYKRELAKEWQTVLGAPPLRTREDNDREKAIAKFADWLRSYANAPITLDELYQKQPAAQALVERIRSELGLGLDTRVDRLQILERVELNKALRTSQRKFLFDKIAGPKTKAMTAMLDDPQFEDAWPVFLQHLRRRVLVEDYRMEPDRMIRFTLKYGPIDWRHPSAHALYWSAAGVEESLELVDGLNDRRSDFDFVNTDRIVVQSIQELFRSGEIYFDFRAAIMGDYTIYQAIPNPHFADAYGAVLDEMRMRSYAREGATGRLVNINQLSRERGFSQLSAGYENFMIDVTLFHYRRGERRLAEKWLKELRTFADQNLQDMERRIERFADLDRFAEDELKDSATRPTIMVQQVTGALMGAYASGLLGRDQDLFIKQYEFAKRWHFYFMQQQLRRTAVSRDIGRMEQLDENWNFLAGTMFFQFMQTVGMSEGGYNEDAQSVYFAAPDELRVWVYDALVEMYKPMVDEEAKVGGKPFDVLFPMPNGIEQHRRWLAAELERRAPKDLNTEQQ